MQIVSIHLSCCMVQEEVEGNPVDLSFSVVEIGRCFISKIWYWIMMLQRLENKYLSNPTKYTNLYSMVQEEVEAKTAKGSSSCTNGLLWLTRLRIIFHLILHDLFYGSYSSSRWCLFPCSDFTHTNHSAASMSKFSHALAFWSTELQLKESVIMSLGLWISWWSCSGIYWTMGTGRCHKLALIHTARRWKSFMDG